MQAIPRFQSDPAAKLQDFDVNSFNARAVAQVQAVPEAEEIKVFEAARRKFQDFTRQLTDEDFKDERIVTQFKWELVNHLEEHRIKNLS